LKLISGLSKIFKDYDINKVIGKVRRLGDASFGITGHQTPNWE
jgi:hypothetical protein